MLKLRIVVHLKNIRRNIKCSISVTDPEDEAVTIPVFAAPDYTLSHRERIIEIGRPVSSVALR